MPFAKGGDSRQGRGPRPGTGGRPPSEIRALLRGSFRERVAILEQIADGAAVCTVKAPDGSETQTMVSASPADRLKAIDMLGKYGLGTTQEVTGKDGVPLLPEQRVSRLKALLGIG